jgi:hypothetical protein
MQYGIAETPRPRRGEGNRRRRLNLDFSSGVVLEATSQANLPPCSLATEFSIWLIQLSKKRLHRNTLSRGVRACYRPQVSQRPYTTKLVFAEWGMIPPSRRPVRHKEVMKAGRYPAGTLLVSLLSESLPYAGQSAAGNEGFCQAMSSKVQKNVLCCTKCMTKNVNSDTNW